jgi:hypothetical protein
MKHISEVMDESEWLARMETQPPCPHGFDYPADCLTCRSHDPEDTAFWGTCAHGVSNSPGVECEACEVREDDCDG